jgi:hypothetical protein
MLARPPFRKRKFLKRIVSGTCVASSVAAWASPAAAYRPFDGTDAAVAAPGEVEIELQPAGGLRDETGTSLIAPATVFAKQHYRSQEFLFARACSVESTPVRNG